MLQFVYKHVGEMELSINRTDGVISELECSRLVKMAKTVEKDVLNYSPGAPLKQIKVNKRLDDDYDYHFELYNNGHTIEGIIKLLDEQGTRVGFKLTFTDFLILGVHFHSGIFIRDVVPCLKEHELDSIHIDYGPNVV